MVYKGKKEELKMILPIQVQMTGRLLILVTKIKQV